MDRALEKILDHGRSRSPYSSWRETYRGPLWSIRRLSICNSAVVKAEGHRNQHRHQPRVLVKEEGPEQEPEPE
jgi:hypothetical protein